MADRSPVNFISWPLVKYTVQAALRDRLFIGFIALMGVIISLSFFIGSAVVIEKDQFSVVLAAGGLRLAGAAALILFVCFYVRRAFDRRDVEYLLSRPISRLSFYISHIFAFSVLALIFSVAVYVTLFVIGGGKDFFSFTLWGMTLLLEYSILVAVGLFFSMVLRSAAICALSTFGFYVLARVMGQLLGIINTGNYNATGSDIMAFIFQAISIIVPRFDLLSQSSWLIYGVETAQIGLVLLQSFVFWILILVAGLLDLYKRQF